MAEAQTVDITKEHVKSEIGEGSQNLEPTETYDFFLGSRRSSGRFQLRADIRQFAKY